MAAGLNEGHIEVLEYKPVATGVGWHIKIPEHKLLATRLGKSEQV